MKASWRIAGIAALLAAAPAVASSAGAAQPGAGTVLAARCEAQLGKSVTVTSSNQHGYRIDHTRSFHDLTRLKGSVRRGAWVLGLTHTDGQVRVNVGGSRLRDEHSGYECIAPRIEARLTYLPVVVYVSREFPVGSCAYREVLAHEMRHLEIYQHFLPKAEQRVREALEQRFDGRPLYAPIGKAQALLNDEVQRKWLPLMKREMGRVEQLQAAIDTPEEYARLSKVCEGEVQSLLQPRTR